ncbi:MAG: hypothetical protein IH795_06200 [Bacteroidetes bacterium]|nr:hypothetical protein [Bacteroidota bacterium]
MEIIKIFKDFEEIVRNEPENVICFVNGIEYDCYNITYKNIKSLAGSFGFRDYYYNPPTIE